jgi:hypothetical protein
MVNVNGNNGKYDGSSGKWYLQMVTANGMYHTRCMANGKRGVGARMPTPHAPVRRAELGPCALNMHPSGSLGSY